MRRLPLLLAVVLVAACRAEEPASGRTESQAEVLARTSTLTVDDVTGWEEIAYLDLLTDDAQAGCDDYDDVPGTVDVSYGNSLRTVDRLEHFALLSVTTTVWDGPTAGVDRVSPAVASAHQQCRAARLRSNLQRNGQSFQPGAAVLDVRPVDVDLDVSPDVSASYRFSIRADRVEAGVRAPLHHVVVVLSTGRVTEVLTFITSMAPVDSDLLGSVTKAAARRLAGAAA